MSMIERRTQPDVPVQGGRRITDLAAYPEAHLTVAECLAYFRVDRRTFSKWVEAGLLVPYRFGPDGSQVVRFKTADVRAFDQQARG
jgi:hypothetical protein